MTMTMNGFGGLMGKRELPYIQRTKARGRWYHYYRRDGQRLRIHGAPGSEEFLENYRRIHSGFVEDDPTKTAPPGSLSWLVWQYRSSPEFIGLRPKTRQDYLWHLERWCTGLRDRNGNMVEAGYGDLQATKISRRFLYAWRDRHQQTPSQTNYSMRVLKLLMSWAVKRDLLHENPIKDVEPLKTGNGWKAWTDAQIRAVKEVAPPAIQAVIDMAQYTGQRREDLCSMTWNDLDDGGIWVVQEKTREKVWIPLHPDLQARLEELRRNRKAAVILTTTQGRPWKSGHMTHQVKFWTRKAHIEDINLHGLRKTASVRMAECGCTEEQIKSVTGHKTSAMVAHYVRGANQKRLAREAMRKVVEAARQGENDL